MPRDWIAAIPASSIEPLSLPPLMSEYRYAPLRFTRGKPRRTRARCSDFAPAQPLHDPLSRWLPTQSSPNRPFPRIAPDFAASAIWASVSIGPASSYSGNAVARLVGV
jgi:hypothetical protein